MSNTYFFPFPSLRVGVANVACSSQYACHLGSMRAWSYCSGVAGDDDDDDNDDDEEEEEVMRRAWLLSRPGCSDTPASEDARDHLDTVNDNDLRDIDSIEGDDDACRRSLENFSGGLVG